MSNASTHEPDPKPGKQDVADVVLQDIKDRVDAGLKKYGTKLQTLNGRDALVDLYQELIDAVMYTRQLMLERDAELSALRSPAPAAPKCVYCGSPMPKGEIRCQVCHPDEKPAPDAPVTGWRPEWGVVESGDEIAEGDEWWDERDYTWNAVYSSKVGQVHICSVVMRRRLSQPALEFKPLELSEKDKEFIKTREDFESGIANGWREK